MAHPSAILTAAAGMIRSGELLEALSSSVRNLLLGYVLAATVGICTGMLMGRYRLLEYSLDLFVNALYATPLVALIPLVILWFGLGDLAKVFIIFLLAVFTILINTCVGVRDVSQNLVEMGLAFCASERQIFTKIVLPAALPFIMV